MKIAVLGAGMAGGTLGALWSGRGHQVTFGVHPESTRFVPGGTRQATISDAAYDAEVVVLAVPWPAVPVVLGLAAEGLADKVLLDCTNPLGWGPLFGYHVPLEMGPNGESGAERIAQMAPEAHVVKIFNSTGYSNFSGPWSREQKAFMPYAGDSVEAKANAHRLAEDLRLDPVDVGPLVMARELEHLASLWIAVSQDEHRSFAFGILERRPRSG